MATKKGVGDVMNQLAIISDLLENINLDTEQIKVEIELKNEDFDELHNRVVQKRGLLMIPKKTFNMMVSGIMFTFKRV
jgi:hypothetical protein